MNRRRLLQITALISLALAGIIIKANPKPPQESGDCIECHLDKYDGPEYMHPGQLACLSCHFTHSNNRGSMYLSDKTILCQEPCHTNMGRSHPVGRNLINPTTKQTQEVTCTNYCHDAHGSRFAGILKMPARQLCFSCHNL
jgi:predicted CXXCH cytochrome family protein